MKMSLLSQLSTKDRHHLRLQLGACTPLPPVTRRACTSHTSVGKASGCQAGHAAGAAAGSWLVREQITRAFPGGRCSC